MKSFLIVNLFLQLNDCLQMNARDESCKNSNISAPNDTVWRLKIFKDVGLMSKSVDIPTHTQTSETRIIKASELEKLVPQR